MVKAIKDAIKKSDRSVTPTNLQRLQADQYKLVIDPRRATQPGTDAMLQFRVTVLTADGSEFSDIGFLFGSQSFRKTQPWKTSTLKELFDAMQEALRRDGVEIGNILTHALECIISYSEGGRVLLGNTCLSDTMIQGQTGHHFILRSRKLFSTTGTSSSMVLAVRGG